MSALAVYKCKPEPPLSQPEEDLKISIDAPSYKTTPAADFDFKLKIESAMPVNGVQVEYNVKVKAITRIMARGPLFTLKLGTHSNKNKQFAGTENLYLYGYGYISVQELKHNQTKF